MPEAAATAPATPPDLEACVRHWQEDLAVGEKEEQRLRRLVVHDDEFVPVFSKPCDSAPNEAHGIAKRCQEYCTRGTLATARRIGEMSASEWTTHLQSLRIFVTTVTGRAHACRPSRILP